MKRIILASLLSIFLASCTHFDHETIKGNGKMVTQSRDINGFDRLEVSGGLDVYIMQDSSFSVKVDADENLQDYIIIEKKGNTIVIRQKNNTNLRSTGKIKIHVSAPAFHRLEASGASNITGDNLISTNDQIEIEATGASDIELELKCPKVDTHINGASGILLKGQTKELTIEGSGASHAKCYELLSETTSVDISGASHADVFASVKLDAEASGASTISYKGNATVTKSESGASNVEKSD